MAKRRLPVVPVAFEAPVDERPRGSLLFADPAKAEFPRHIHTHNWPQTHQGNQFKQSGIRSITGRLVPWESRQYEGQDPWETMNDKRGVTDADTEEG